MTFKSHAGLFAAVLGIATVGISAQTQQTPPQPPPTQQAQPSARAAAPGDITVTGCLKEAPASAADAAAPVGTSGTTGAAGAAGATTPGPQYILSDATKSAAEGNAPSADAAAAASASPQTYRLIANASALTPHLGKKLELVGTLEANASAGSAAEANTPALRVKSGKIVAASCTP